MPRSSRSRRGSGGRGPRRVASRIVAAAPDLEAFDEAWLRRIGSRSFARRIDLTQLSDRRLYAPDKVKHWGRVSRPDRLYKSNRVLIVPQGHRLARHALFNHPVHRFLGRRGVTEAMAMREGRVMDAHSFIVCVRRTRRREVLFAKFGGGGAAAKWSLRKVIRRGWSSEVEC